MLFLGRDCQEFTVAAGLILQFAILNLTFSISVNFTTFIPGRLNKGKFKSQNWWLAGRTPSTKIYSRKRGSP